MKKIYFVRHGESEGNAGPFRQGPDTPLTEEGQKQAEIVARRLEEVPIDIVISSTYTRARQTAKAINDILLKPIEYSDLIVERKRPSAIINKHKDDKEVIEIERLVIENFHSPEWKHSDEENFWDVKKRALETIAFLESRPEENILVVTHGLFMKTLFACVMFGKDITSKEYENLFLSLICDNTGISVLERRDFSKFGHPWVVATWNDHAHLEELINN